MPQLFKVGNYIIYFWSNEGHPPEPVHVHAALGDPTKNATKIWITQDGHALLCNNNSRIPGRTLRLLMRIIEANSDFIIQRWKKHFEQIRYYC